MCDELKQEETVEEVAAVESDVVEEAVEPTEEVAEVETEAQS